MTPDEIKASIDLVDYIRGIGVTFTEKGDELVCCCPFPDHDDSNPSFSVNPAKQLFRCFGCDRKGSVIDFEMAYSNLSLPEALRRLSGAARPRHVRQRDASLCTPESASRTPVREAAASSANGRSPMNSNEGSGESTTPRRGSGQRPESGSASSLLTDVAAHYERALWGRDKRGLEYLKSRGLTDPETLKHFGAGFADGSLKKVLSPQQTAELREAGLITADGSEFFSGCVVVPLRDAAGAAVGFYGRAISAANGGPVCVHRTGRHYYLPGPRRGLVNREAAHVYDTIILTEAVLDAMSLFQAGQKNVIACYGTNGFTPEHEQLLAAEGKPVILAFDSDEAGCTAAKRLSVRLKEKNLPCGILTWPSGVKDAIDYFAYDRDFDRRRTLPEFLKLLDKASRCFSSSAETPKRTRSRARANGLYLANRTASELVFSSADKVFYKLRGLYANGVTSLKLVVTAGLDEHVGANGKAAVTDRFDLYVARSRKSFAWRVEERLGRAQALTSEDLDRLIPRLEVLREEHHKPDTAEPEPPREMSAAEKQQALALLRSPQLLDRIAADLETAGYAGEDAAKQLVYLVATSRKLSKPLSAIIRSESGAGKSFLMECVAELMPEEDVEFFSRLTPQSLYYMGRDRLVHKLLIVDERDGSEEAEYPIRTLQTRRKLTLAVPFKDDKGQISTRVLVINGPIAYMESTTSVTINPENANRCFEIFLDESEEQTRRVFRMQRDARTLAGWRRERRRDDVVLRHQNAQRLLEPVRVIIPYAHEIRFPAAWMRNRRDHDRFPSLIEAVAFLHQHQREHKSDPENGAYIEATADDYEAAWRLAGTVLRDSLAELPRSAGTLFARLRAMVEEQTAADGIKVRDFWFRRRRVREFTRLPDHQLKRGLRTLADLEYLEVRGKGNGSTHYYRLNGTHTDPDVMKGVTTPRELRKRLASPQTEVTQ